MVSQDDNIIRPTVPEEEQVLIELYRSTQIPLDGLPYTEEFELLVKHYAQRFELEISNETRRNIFLQLARLRKSGKMPRLQEVVKETENSVEF